MILLFIGGLVVGALAGIFALGLISSGHCAECRAYYDRQMEAMRRGENRWHCKHLLARPEAPEWRPHHPGPV